MSSIAQRDPFERLLQSSAKGFFFLKQALADHTTEQKLASIINKAHGVYDRGVENQQLECFQPYFTFATDDAGHVKIVISREASGAKDALVLGEVLLTRMLDPVHKQPILAVTTDLPMPRKRLKNLPMRQLLQELELYYELLDVCNGNLLNRLVKTFQETETACPAVYRYELSSTESHVGLSVKKNDKRHFVMFVELKA